MIILEKKYHAAFNAFIAFCANSRLICTILIIFVLMNQISFVNASVLESAMNTVKNMTSEIEEILEEDIANDNARGQKVSLLFVKYFDLHKIAQGSVGQYWRTASQEQKKEYKILLREIIIKTVTQKIDGLDGLKFSVKKAEAKGRGLTFVDGVYRDKSKKRPDVNVRWLLFQTEDRTAKIVDITIENLSMLTTQRQENISVIRRGKGQFSALIDAMQKQSLQTKN